VPNFDMRFETEDDAFELYRKYAEKAGFPIKKNEN
jgi:hypothetical protein